MQLERLNASLLSHVRDVDGTLKVSSAASGAKLACEVARLTTEKDAQRQPHPVGLEAAVDCETMKLNKHLELIANDHTAKHNDVQSSFATAHWNVQKFKMPLLHSLAAFKPPASCPPLPPQCSCLGRIWRPGDHVIVWLLVYGVTT